MNEFTNVRPKPVENDEIVIPDRVAKLPWSKKHKAPIPWFVETVNGEPDFRIVKAERMVQAIRQSLCWICGARMGQYMAFVIGPMCAINRISSEPPSHRECAIYAARACPFLSHPNKDRRAAGLPEDIRPADGIMLLHNPGVALVWVCKGYRVRTLHGKTEYLFTIGQPSEVLWYAEGRTATRVEVEAAIAKGLPHLQALASQDGPEGASALAAAIDASRPYLPAV